MGVVGCCAAREPETWMPETSATASAFCTPNNRGKCYEDEYQVLNKPIGAGNYGTVKTVISRRCGNRRALKHVLKKPDMIRMLRTEVDINLMIDHANVVKLFNVFEDKRYVYFVLELCEGQSLDFLQGAPVQLHNLAFIMESVLSALTYLHGQGIVHRDLKPQNMVLKGENVPLECNTIKLLDFGLAQKILPGQKTLKTTLGTPLFIAPEIWSKVHYNEKCDIWSAGVIMYELLSTEYPFTAESVAELSKSVTKNKLSFEYYTWASIDTATKAFIELLLKKNPDERISASAAWQHDWIRSHHPSSMNGDQPQARRVDSSMCGNMKAFSGKSRFEQAAISIVAHLLDDSEIQDLQRTFKALDVDGNGTLSLQEVEQAFKDTKLSANLEELFGKVNFNGSSEIEYSTFIAAMMNQRLFHKQEHLWRAFKTIDQDNMNCITAEQLSQSLRNLDMTDAPVSPEEIQSVMSKTDINGDGLISFEEFVALICGTHHAETELHETPVVNQTKNKKLTTCSTTGLRSSLLEKRLTP